MLKLKKSIAANKHIYRNPHLHKRHWRKQAIIAFSVLSAAAGIYILLLLLPTAVYVPSRITPKEKVAEQKIIENGLHIPKLGLSIPYLTGGPQVLNENAWHRFPERGDPVKGGNFILSAHRFHLGLTPGATKRRSPLYHIDKLVKGDKLYVDFEGKRYEYEVTDSFSVQPTQTQIEKSSEESKLTLYSCTLKGELDGRDVIIAKLLKDMSATPVE